MDKEELDNSKVSKHSKENRPSDIGIYVGADVNKDEHFSIQENDEVGERDKNADNELSGTFNTKMGINMNIGGEVHNQENLGFNVNMNVQGNNDNNVRELDSNNKEKVRGDINAYTDWKVNENSNRNPTLEANINVQASAKAKEDQEINVSNWDSPEKKNIDDITDKVKVADQIDMNTDLNIDLKESAHFNFDVNANANINTGIKAEVKVSDQSEIPKQHYYEEEINPKLQEKPKADYHEEDMNPKLFGGDAQADLNLKVTIGDVSRPEKEELDKENKMFNMGFPKNDEI